MESPAEILILDDEADIADALRRLIERLGYRACAIYRPAAALELLGAQPGRFSVLITDMSMPGMNGREVLAQARALDPQLKVILSSGSPGHGPAGPAFDASLVKPFGIPQLSAALEKVLRG